MFTSGVGLHSVTHMAYAATVLAYRNQICGWCSLALFFPVQEVLSSCSAPVRIVKRRKHVRVMSFSVGCLLLLST